MGWVDLKGVLRLLKETSRSRPLAFIFPPSCRDDSLEHLLSPLEGIEEDEEEDTETTEEEESEGEDGPPPTPKTTPRPEEKEGPTGPSL